jgi:uncharacterized peroxidase-related enzyme
MTRRSSKAGRISWLRAPVARSFAPDVRALHKESLLRLGYVRNFLKLPFGPGRLALYQRFLDRLMRSDDCYLPGIERELLALVTSVENRCEPCVHAHAAALRKHGMDGVKVDEIMISWRRAGLSLRHRALAEFAWKLTVRPAEADETWIGALRAAGLSEKQIFEAAQIVGIYNSNNRINNVIGLHIDR